MVKVKDILKICNGKLICGDEEIICNSFSIDTRKIEKDCVFIGLKGKHMNGNLLYQEAFNKGAAVAILEEDYFQKEDDVIYEKPIILVKDTVVALQELAKYKRNISKANFVGVTGSVGKTSTKDLIYSVLSTEYKALKTEGNYNNNLGLPLTLLRIQEEDAVVVEMGMNALGEISFLSHIAKPNIAVITNVGTAHIGNLGSRENILKAKLEIRDGMDKDGILIINNDNDLLHSYYLENKNGILSIGIENDSDIMAMAIEEKESFSKFMIRYKENEYKVNLPYPGRAFIYNALLAFAVGISLHMTPDKIIHGLETAELTKNRNDIINENGYTIINGVYNANVESMKSSIEVLSKSNTRKVAILGSMLELGSYTIDLHKEIGNFVEQNKIDVLITIGQDAKYIGSSAKEKGMHDVYSFETKEEAIPFIKQIVKPKDTILLKASHGLHLEEVLEAITKH